MSLATAAKNSTMLKLVLAIAGLAASLKPQPRPATASTRRAFFGVASSIIAGPAFAASSDELKGMLGKLDEELSDEGLAKTRKIKIESDGPKIELPKVSAPKITREPKPPKEPKAPKPKKEGGAAPAPSPFANFVNGDGVDFGAAAREEGRARAEARKAKAAPPPAEREAAVAPSSAADATDDGEVYVALRAKREAQRQAAEDAAEKRKYNRLTPVEQAKYRAENGRAPK